MFVQLSCSSPGRGMCMPGKGTRKGGTMTGGKAGMAAVGWATLWGRAAGSSGTVWTAVTGDGTVETVTTVTGDTATVEVTVATGAWSATTVAAGNNINFKLSLSVHGSLHTDCWYAPEYLPEMVTEGEGVVTESGLEVCVWDRVEVGAWVGEAAPAVLAVVLPLLELTAAVTPTLALEPEAAAPATIRGFSSDCWMTFTPSGLLHDDSLVRAL